MIDFRDQKKNGASQFDSHRLKFYLAENQRSAIRVRLAAGITYSVLTDRATRVIFTLPKLARKAIRRVGLENFQLALFWISSSGVTSSGFLSSFSFSAGFAPSSPATPLSFFTFACGLLFSLSDVFAEVGFVIDFVSQQRGFLFFSGR